MIPFLLLPVAIVSQNSSYWHALSLPRATRLPDPQEEATRPLLSLVMMVKNEAKTIGGIIDSVLPWVDRYTILDTGSDDETVALARTHFGRTPGDIHHGRFTTYAETRNRVLELEGTRSVFRLFLSGDEFLRNGEVLRQWCEEHRHWRLEDGKDGEAFMVEVLWGSGLRYLMPLVSRSDARWSYEGVTHEYLKGPLGEVSSGLPLVKHGGKIATVYRPGFSDASEKPKRWRKDLELLLTALQDEDLREGLRQRYTFYVARTYSDLDEHEQCAKWFKRRAAMRGWKEEEYVARVLGVRCSAAAGDVPWPKLQQQLLDAHTMLPDRADALHAIGRHYLRANNPQLALLFLKQAMEIPFPTHHVLFTNRDYYDWDIPRMLATAAARTGRHNVVGLKAARKALASKPRDQPMQRLARSFELALSDDSTVVMVSGAGSAAVNGVYHPSGAHGGARQYEMNKGSRAFELFRLPSSTGATWWNIQERNSSGKYLAVYYGARDPLPAALPPSDGWAGREHKATWAGLLPPPQIIVTVNSKDEL